MKENMVWIMLWGDFHPVFTNLWKVNNYINDIIRPRYREVFLEEENENYLCYRLYPREEDNNPMVYENLEIYSMPIDPINAPEK